MFNVAILGTRPQGSHHHAPSFARLPDCRIVAVCDIVEERAQEGADRYGVPAYTSADEMLDRKRDDALRDSLRHSDAQSPLDDDVRLVTHHKITENGVEITLKAFHSVLSGASHGP